MVGVIVVFLGLVTWIVVVARRASNLTKTSDSRLASELMVSAAVTALKEDAAAEPAPDKSASGVAAPHSDDIEARLAKLADLHDRKLISDEELAAARAKILAE